MEAPTPSARTKPAKERKINWLAITFGAQVILFGTFIIVFFTLEQSRSSEMHVMQSELHRLRRENVRRSRKLMEYNKRMLLKEEQIEHDLKGEELVPEEGEDDEGDERLPPAADEDAARAHNRTSSAAKGCARLASDWWMYEVCLGRQVRQYHPKNGKGAPEAHVLGVYSAAESTAARHVYADGEACPGRTSHPRRATVSLRCAPAAAHARIAAVDEPSPCVYALEVELPADECRAAGLAASPASAAASPAPTNGAAAPPSDLPADLASIPVDGAQAAAQKRRAVVGALRHAWAGYVKYAWGADELKPLGKTSSNWIGQGLTILDSLDVLWLAGMRDEFARGVEWVRASLRLDSRRMVSFFETTIRCLGGLLAAYELSGEPLLLDKALDLGERLAKAFVPPVGLPRSQIDLGTGASSVAAWLRGSVLLAEVGTVQLEFFSLANHTGRMEFHSMAHKVIDLLDREGPPAVDGGRLWPIHVRPETGKTTGNTVSWGAMGDSFYEYLLKMWLITGKTHEQYKRMYLESVKGMQNKLVRVEDGLTYIAELKAGLEDRKMDHLVCFVPGMLALGAQHIPEVHDEHMELAARLAETCYNMYSRQRTGLAPEFVNFRNGKMVVGARHNLLRPETVESLFYMWRFTKDPKYREWGWKIFVAFEKHCKVESGGYTGLRDVNADGWKPGNRDDTMQTFWLAETLKYLLLLFSDDEVLDLNTHVINTEAHPLKVFSLKGVP
ncbi:hypothetical protein AB1Y20_010206 [Prymnesium parvum]|uniref:alpha-1,2-Mannosidase n=1 Tax=Prymnesium parvum TaxID=97485 RepID=A0AB34K6S1_PRYPA